MNNALNHYCNEFKKLRVDRANGVAPHKPLLLLSVIEQIEIGRIQHNQIELSPELMETFSQLWCQLVLTKHNEDIKQPFFYLKSSGFWHHKAKPGFESIVDPKSKITITTISAINQTIAYAYFDEKLFELLQDPNTRNILVNVLVTTWFPNHTQQIERLLRVDFFQELQDQLRSTGGAVYKDLDIKDEAKVIVRDAAFRREVVKNYEHRCALCGLKAHHLNSNIVDGAHIQPFSQFRDDRFDNGLSLCKNHHWGFDRGWFSLSDDFTILVSDNLYEESPHARPMRAFHQERIWLPQQQQYHPRLEAIRWHRQHVFGEIRFVS